MSTTINGQVNPVAKVATYRSNAAADEASNTRNRQDRSFFGMVTGTRTGWQIVGLMKKGQLSEAKGGKMRNKSWMFTLSVVFLLANAAFSKGSSKWGPDEGATFRYHDAVKRCKSKGMRLPTVRELKVASKIATMHWLGTCNDPSDCRDMAHFWTSDKAPRGSLMGDRSAVWLISKQDGSLKIEVVAFHSTGSDARVRCVKG